MTFTIQEWRAALIRMSALLVGGGTVEIGPVTIIVTAEPGEPDKHLDPVDGSAEKERVHK